MSVTTPPIPKKKTGFAPPGSDGWSTPPPPSSTTPANQLYDDNGQPIPGASAPTDSNNSVAEGATSPGRNTTGNVAEGINAYTPPPPTGPPAGAPPVLPPPTTGSTGYNSPRTPTSVPSNAPPELPPPGQGGTSVTPPSSSGLLADPGAYEQWIKAHAGDLDKPTRAENLYDAGGASSLDNSPLNGVTTKDSSAAYNDWLSTHGSVTGAGNSSSVLSSLPTGPSKSSDVYTTASGTLGKPSATEDVYGKDSAAFDSPGAREAWYAKYGNDPMQKSYTETLYEGGIGQLDPAYQYAQDKALRAAQTASAARGGFNSGYAGQEERDIAANLRGQQAKEWVDLAPQADAAKRARYTQGEQFAGDSNADYRQRINDTFNIAGLNDKATNDRLDTLSTIAGRGDSADNAANNTRVTAAGNADRSATDIYRAEGEAQGRGADLTREQGDQNINLATAQDAANRNNVTTKFKLAGDADSSQMGRFGVQAGLEKDLQATGQNRILGGLDATTSQADREAKLVQDIYSDTANIDSMDDTALQALADKYGVSLQELESVKGDAKSLISLLTSAVSGGKK